MPSGCQQRNEALSKYVVNREYHHQMTQKFAQLYKTLYKVENKQNTVYKNMRLQLYTTTLNHGVKHTSLEIPYAQANFSARTSINAH